MCCKNRMHLNRLTLLGFMLFPGPLPANVNNANVAAASANTVASNQASSGNNIPASSVSATTVANSQGTLVANYPGLGPVNLGVAALPGANPTVLNNNVAAEAAGTSANSALVIPDSHIVQPRTNVNLVQSIPTDSLVDSGIRRIADAESKQLQSDLVSE
jgi:hypothetical protein